MKKKTTSKSAFFNPRVLLSFALCSAGVFLALLGSGAFSNVFAQAKSAARDSAPAAVAQNISDDAPLSPADDNGRFVYLIEFAEPGMMHRQTREPNERFRADTPASAGSPRGDSSGASRPYPDDDSRNQSRAGCDPPLPGHPQWYRHSPDPRGSADRPDAAGSEVDRARTGLRIG